MSENSIGILTMVCMNRENGVELGFW